MTDKFILIIACFALFSCSTNGESGKYNISFSNEFNEYIKNNNIHISYSIDNSKYVGPDFYTFDLSKEQKENLIHFIQIFQSSDKYIKYINYENLAKYDIKRIDIRTIDVIGFNIKAQYGIYCTFHSKNKIAEYSVFDKAENLWWTFNIALYQIINDDDLKFDGWHN
jgi:hypothetical protein